MADRTRSITIAEHRQPWLTRLTQWLTRTPWVVVWVARLAMRAFVWRTFVQIVWQIVIFQLNGTWKEQSNSKRKQGRASASKDTVNEAHTQIVQCDPDTNSLKSLRITTCDKTALKIQRAGTEVAKRLSDLRAQRQKEKEKETEERE